MKTFKQKWNLRTLRKIRKEYVGDWPAEPYYAYLCNTSPTFGALWAQHKIEILEIAKEFSKFAHNTLLPDKERSVLFYTRDLDLMRPHRLDWLDHEIAKRQRQPCKQKAPPPSKRS
jgi:hypothetical protein